MMASASQIAFRRDLLVPACVLFAVLLAPFATAAADLQAKDIIYRTMAESAQPFFALNGNVSAVPPAPELIGPTGSTTTHRPTYQWKKVNGANRYHLSIYLPELKKVILNVKLGNGICSEDTCSYTPKVNFVNRAYRFKVRAGNATGWGPYSLWMNYQVAANQDPAAIVVDHTCTDITKIPEHWLEEARKITFHFAHTSHGSQIITGLAYWKQQAAKMYNFAIKYDPPGLPLGTDRLKIYDGNNYGGDNYITPEMYWDSTQGVNKTKSVSNTGLFDYSMWSWCGRDRMAG